MDLSVFEEDKPKFAIPSVGDLRNAISGIAKDNRVYCQITSKDGKPWIIHAENILEKNDKGFLAFNFNQSKLEEFLSDMKEDFQEVEELDNSWGGIVAMCDNISNSELKDAILHRIDYVSSAEKRVQEAEARLDAMKFDLMNHKNGLKRMINFKKLEYPVMIDDPKNYYEVSQNGEQIYIKTITKQL